MTSKVKFTAVSMETRRGEGPNTTRTRRVLSRCRHTLRAGIVVVLGFLLVVGSALSGTAVRAEQKVTTPAPYVPYAFLIGEWDVGLAGGKPAAVSRFRWGPARTYIWYSGALLVEGGEQPSWEGLLVWNGVRKSVDFLLVLEPASGNLVQEQGTVHVAPDGTVVREITAFYSEGNAVPPKWDKAAGPEGTSAQFRHTFKPDGPNRILSSVMRKTESGWVPNFPGSDHLVMTRRAASN